MKTGASLVPVLSFGENNIFQVSKPKEKSTMALVQKWACQALLFSLFCLMACSVMLALPYAYREVLMSGFQSILRGLLNVTCGAWHDCGPFITCTVTT